MTGEKIKKERKKKAQNLNMKPIFLNQENLLLKKWIKTVAYVEKQKYYY